MTAHAIYYLRCKCGASFEGWRGEQYFSEEQVRKAASEKGWKHFPPNDDFCSDCIENTHRIALVDNYIYDHRVDGSWSETVRLVDEYYEQKEINTSS